jgi:hypothetical protein
MLNHTHRMRVYAASFTEVSDKFKKISLHHECADCGYRYITSQPGLIDTATGLLAHTD